jgi:hypothetical protein
MNDDDDELKRTKQQLESKQVSLFLVLLCVGIFISAVLFDGRIDSWGFFVSSWVACYIAWVLSKLA